MKNCGQGLCVLPPGKGLLLALSAHPLAPLFAFFLASTNVPRIISLLLGLVQEKAEVKWSRLARREHECPGFSLHGLMSPRLLGIRFPLPLSSLGCCGLGLRDMASSTVVTEKHNYPSPSLASQKSHRDQGLISKPGRVGPVPQSNAGACNPGTSHGLGAAEAAGVKGGRDVAQGRAQPTKL